MMKKPYFLSLNFSPDQLALCLNKCLKGKALRQGKQIHGVLLGTGMNMNLLSLNSKLVGMYASCGDMRYAKYVFDKIPKPNIFALNWLVFASAFNGSYKEAIGYFSLMKELGITGNKFSFSIVLKACVGLMELNKGREVHSMVYKMGFENDVSVGNAMIDMYCKCGSLCYARNVFDKMIERDVPCWTSMICGYFNGGKSELALDLFEGMKLEGLEPNEFTWNAMIVGFARCGDIHKVTELFSSMRRRRGHVPDLVTWNAIISGFVQSQHVGEALEMFRNMIVSGIKPNQVTITGLLPVCGLTGSVQTRLEIHGLIYRMGVDINTYVGCALVDMYSKCGGIKNARSVFDSVHNKNVALWNVMIGCYGKHGMVDLSLELFERMEEGMQVNEVTLVCVLSACGHSGLVEKGLEIFSSMKARYGVEASKEHYACVVDMLCRSGKMEEAYEIVKGMPMVITESIAIAFFSGCKIHGRRDLAKVMAEDLLKLELKRPGAFVTLSNIYAAHGEWEKVQSLRKVMKEKHVHKSPGFSWLEKRD